jgi:glycosyltransferase involved in cell wall biosynthesis
MTAVHQLLPTATPRDAITEQAFVWRDLLGSWGLESELVAEHVDPELAGVVRRLDRKARKLLDEGALVLHYAVWSATIETALKARGPLALNYHNVTPGELLRDFNPGIAEICDLGRRSLSVFRGRTDTVLTASHFSAADLNEAGVSEVSVVPMLIEVPREAPRRSPSREPVVVTVGRVVPNKRIEDVIKAFTLYQRSRAPQASLVVVGSDLGFENYRHALDLLVARIGARNVVFTGPVSSEARNSWYRRADAYLAMSVHEGFCVPLVEALSSGVPVVARDAAAMPETLGGAGLVVDGEDLPLVAEALHEVASSRSTRTVLYDAADRRLAELSPEVVGPQIRSALEPVLKA